MRTVRKLAHLARASAYVLTALAMGGCVATVAEVTEPDVEPGSEYHQGYMAGVAFADDGWNDIGKAAEWMDANSVTSTDFAIQKALNNLPADVVQNHSLVWIEAFRAGASTRFDQYRVAARKAGAKTSQWIAAGTLASVLAIVVLSGLAAQ